MTNGKTDWRSEWLSCGLSLYPQLTVSYHPKVKKGDILKLKGMRSYKKLGANSIYVVCDVLKSRPRIAVVLDSNVKNFAHFYHQDGRTQLKHADGNGVIDVDYRNWKYCERLNNEEAKKWRLLSDL